MLQQPNIVDELEARVRNGEVLDREELINEYYPHTEPVIAAYRLAGQLQTVRRHLNKDGLPLVSVGRGKIDIPKSKQDYMYAHNRTLRHLYGLYTQANILFSYGQDKRLLPPGLDVSTLKLPALSLPQGK